MNSQCLVRGSVVFQQDLQQQIKNHFENDLRSLCQVTEWKRSKSEQAISDRISFYSFFSTTYEIFSPLCLNFPFQRRQSGLTIEDSGFYHDICRVAKENVTKIYIFRASKLWIPLKSLKRAIRPRLLVA